jgi:rhamnogalacturonyl hydrolase YesR
MPFHSEMSDAVFMGGPILAAAGRLTGERRYFDAALRHFDFMAAKVIRPDRLYRHSPLDEAAWGRGNGFPALGLALMISEWPAAEPGREQLVAAHRRHLAALLPHQDPAGEWRQVIDRPESYRELTATCMITFALMRGMRLGWLDRESFSRAADRGWQAVLTRVADDGRLVDVCTGTGKQTSLRAYYDREALLGRDPRGGAMSLLVATERMAFVAPPR